MSYVSQQFLLCDNSSLANFKNWAQAISTALSTSGWTQTADTGQVNWGTIVSVPTSGNFVYEVWQPADALQTGSTKFYFKIKYGTSSGSPAGVRIQAQVGTATDGAGNLTGITLTNYDMTDTSNAGRGSVVTYDCYFSGDLDRFGFLLWRSLNNVGQTCSFLVERTHNTDGTNSSDGVSVVMGSRGNSVNNPGQQTLVFGVGAAAVSTSNSEFVGLSDTSNASQAFNNNIPVSPCFPMYGKYGNPMTMLAFVHNQDVAEGCIFTSTLYGATRTYIATNVMQVNNPPNCKFCMRYD